MICSKEKCTGCSACYNICPNKAIVMKEDEYGFIFPFIDENKCTNCNLCRKVCPQLSGNLAFNVPTIAFAMYNKDPQKRKESTSGGAASSFYEMFLKKNGVVYGVSNLYGSVNFSFIRIEDESDIYKLKGSKYVQCYINDSYKMIKEDLDNNRKVLFIGTPCQVSGLKLFLQREYNNLVTIDIVCHGVPSQRLLFDELKNLNIDISSVGTISFRDEKGFNIKIMNNDGKMVYEKFFLDNDFYRNFLNGNTYRESCYSCNYARKERVSDVTIGDFWGLSKDSSVYDDEKKGISLIIPNTEKGINMVKSIYKDSIIEERNINEAYIFNGQLNHPMVKTKAHEIFIKLYPTLGYEKTMKKMVTFKEKIKMKFRNNKLIYQIYKLLKNRE